LFRFGSILGTHGRARQCAPTDVTLHFRDLMAKSGTKSNIARGFVLAGLLAAGIGFVLWPRLEPAPKPVLDAEPQPIASIPESGRQSFHRSALRQGNAFALVLGLSDEARGSGGPRPTKIIDVEGRVLEVDARPQAGAGTGVIVEIDPDWLVAGKYLIQIETVEVGSLRGLRRYTLEVRE
jgi:hypothetical protein